MAKKLIEEFAEYLQDYAITYLDLLADEDGIFFLSTEENGTSGEDGYEVRTKKCYIPDKFNELVNIN